MKKYFTKRSEMTAYAQATGLEIIRCKQACEHYPEPCRSAILLVDSRQIIVDRLVRCKVCANNENVNG